MEDGQQKDRRLEREEAAASRRLEKSRPWFVFLMINFLPSTKTNTHVDFSRRPRRRWHRLNTGKIKSARNTKPAENHWELEMVLGPIQSKRQAQEMANNWKARSRGLKSRRDKGIVIAQDGGLVCWDKRLDEEEGALQTLHSYADERSRRRSSSSSSNLEKFDAARARVIAMASEP